MQLRTFGEPWQGQIGGSSAAGGKIGGGNIDFYLKEKMIIKDINKLKLKKSDLIIAYYTLQFIEPRYKQLLLNKIYKSLNWGGALILFEKVRANDARFQDILNSLYYDFKEENGFKSNEIFDKEKSLRGVLEPFSDAGNRGLLKRAGFVDTISIYKYISFKGYLCIK